jgi:hypothetical protein
VGANVIIVEANQEAHSFEDEDSTVLFSTKLLACQQWPLSPHLMRLAKTFCAREHPSV